MKKKDLKSEKKELESVKQELTDGHHQLNDVGLYAEAIVTTISEPLIILDNNLRIKIANRAFCKEFKLTEKEIAGKLFYEIRNNFLDNAELRSLLEKILPEQEKIENYEMKCTPFFNERIMLVNAQPLINEKNTEELIFVAIEDITLKKMAEEKEAIIEAIHHPLLVLDKEFRIKIVNAAFCNKFSTTKGKTEGQLFYETGNFLWDIPLLRSMLEKVIPEKKELNDFEITINLPPLGEYNLLLNSRPIMNNKIASILLIIEDITEKKIAQKRLKETETRYKNVLLQSPSLFGILEGPEMIITLANEPLLKSWDKTKNVIGKPLLEVLPEIKDQPFPKLLNNVYKTGKSYIGNEVKTVLIRNGKPEEAYFNFVYQANREADNTISGITMMANDVTEQIAGRKIIEESEAQFRMLADNIPNLAWMADAEGFIYWYNKKWYEYTGTTLADMEGWGWQSVHDPEELPKVLIKWKASIATGKPFEMTFPLKGVDGKFRPFLTRVSPLYNSDHKIYRWIGTNTDVSNQKEVEE